MKSDRKWKKTGGKKYHQLRVPFYFFFFRLCKIIKLLCALHGAIVALVKFSPDEKNSKAATASYTLYESH